MAAAEMGIARTGRGQRPLLSELLVGLDWAALKIAPVYYGIGAPRGDGAPVVLVPGFLGSDRSLLEMHLWLGRVGYRSYLAGVGRIADCPDTLINRLLDTIDRAYNETGSKVRLIGHSLGGLLARAAAVRRPDQVARVITLASPFRRLSAHPFVLGLLRLVRDKALLRHFKNGEVSCDCSFLEALGKPLPGSVGSTAIYTKTDPIVDWRDCVESDQALNIEVRGTHIGLTVNPGVYREVARLLAPPESVRTPGRTDKRSAPDLKRAA